MRVREHERERERTRERARARDLNKNLGKHTQRFQLGVLTCLQWFWKTMRQVSGSAVQGLAGAAFRPDREPVPLGVRRLNQLILPSHTHRGGRRREERNRGEEKRVR